MDHFDLNSKLKFCHDFLTLMKYEIWNISKGEVLNKISLLLFSK